MVKPTKNNLSQSTLRKKGKKSVSTHSRKHAEPAELGGLIRMINAIDVDLPTIQELRALAIRDGGDLIQLVKEQIELMPEGLRQYVSKYLEPEPGRTWFEMVPFSSVLMLPVDPFERYDSLATGRRLLRAIARRGFSLRDHMDMSSDRRWMIDIEGKLRPRKSSLDTALDDVDASYIRECPVCNDIFWAGRKDKKGCSPRCAKKLQNARAHKKYREKCDLDRKRLAHKKQSKKGK